MPGKLNLMVGHMRYKGGELHIIQVRYLKTLILKKKKLLVTD